MKKRFLYLRLRPNTVPVIQAREDLSREAKEAIRGGNALRLFGMSL